MSRDVLAQYLKWADSCRVPGPGGFCSASHSWKDSARECLRRWSPHTWTGWDASDLSSWLPSQEWWRQWSACTLPDRFFPVGGNLWRWTRNQRHSDWCNKRLQGFLFQGSSDRVRAVMNCLYRNSWMRRETLEGIGKLPV